MTTNQTGTWVDDALFYPWGETWKYVEDFAGLPYYDTKTTNDFAAFRVYSPNIGRWFSPDSVRGDVTNPQALDLYSYVTDNPTTLTDPLGLCGCGGGSGFLGGGRRGWLGRRLRRRWIWRRPGRRARSTPNAAYHPDSRSGNNFDSRWRPVL